MCNVAQTFFIKFENLFKSENFLGQPILFVTKFYVLHDKVNDKNDRELGDHAA